MKKQIRYIFAAIGIGIFSVLIAKMGANNILEHLRRVGWGIPLVFLVSIIWYIAYTFAWGQFLKNLSGKIKFFELLKIKVIGDALNTLTPANFIVGDPARAYFLKHHFKFTEGAASVVVDRTLQMIATFVVIIIGTAAALLELKFLPKNIKYGLPIAVTVAAVFIGFIFVHQHKGLFNLLVDISKRLKIKKSYSTETLEKLGAVDGHIQDFYLMNRKGFWLALMAHIFGRMLGIVEIFIIGYAVDPRFTLGTALMLVAAAPVINFAFAFIPGALGVMESAFSAILFFLHFTPATGLTIQLIKRLRAGVWIAIGFILMGTRKNAYSFSNISR